VPQQADAPCTGRGTVRRPAATTIAAAGAGQIEPGDGSVEARDGDWAMRSRFEALSEGLLAAVRDGLTLEDAATRAGVSENTAKGWAREGRKHPEGRFGQFAVALDAARDQVRSSEPMDWTEFEDHLAAAVRAGSVVAMKLYAELHRSDDSAAARPSGDADVLADLD